MALTASNMGATDYFGAGANFHPQSSSAIHTDDAANILDSAGNVECETMVFGRTEYTTEYAYCNATPAIHTDLGTLISSFGFVTDNSGTFVTSLTVSFTAGEYATVSISGVSFDENQPAAVTGLYKANLSAEFSSLVGTSAGFGVPDIGGVTLGDASGASLTVTFTNNLITARNQEGNHLASNPITNRIEAAAEFVGVPTTAEPFTGFTTDTYGPSDSNQEFDTYAVTAHATPGTGIDAA